MNGLGSNAASHIRSGQYLLAFRGQLRTTGVRLGLRDELLRDGAYEVLDVEFSLEVRLYHELFYMQKTVCSTSNASRRKWPSTDGSSARDGTLISVGASESSASPCNRRRGLEVVCGSQNVGIDDKPKRARGSEEGSWSRSRRDGAAPHRCLSAHIYQL